jgi:hypothetical protein
VNTPKIITKRFVVCPSCENYNHEIEHLFDASQSRQFGPWSCQTEDCMTVVSGTIQPDGTVDLQTEVKQKKNGFALLKLRDLYLVRKEPYGRVEPNHADYFYHSHQCPTNLLHHVVEVYGPSGECDQHGMIRYVAGIDDTPETRAALDANPSLRKVFELFGTDGELPPTDWPSEDEGVIPFVAELRREDLKKS